MSGCCTSSWRPAGSIPQPILEQIDYVFAQMLAPSTSTDPQAPLQPAVRSTVADRRDRALHRRAGRFRPQLRLGRLRRRPDSGRSVPLARQRGGRAPLRRPRRRDLLPRQLPRPHPADGDGRHDDVRLLRARHLVPVPHRSRSSTSPGGRCSGCGCATPSCGCCPVYRKAVRHQHLCVLPPDYSPRTTWARPRRRWPTWPAPPPPAPPTPRWCCRRLRSAPTPLLGIGRCRAHRGPAAVTGRCAARPPPRTTDRTITLRVRIAGWWLATRTSSP